MTTRPNSPISVTDVLIAMLSSDLRGSWAERRAFGDEEAIPARNAAEMVVHAAPAPPAACPRGGGLPAR